MFKEEKRRIPPMPEIIKSVVAAGRSADTDEVAAAALYICSPGAAYVTGSSVMVDGGMAIGPTFGM